MYIAKGVNVNWKNPDRVRLPAAARDPRRGALAAAPPSPRRARAAGKRRVLRFARSFSGRRVRDDEAVTAVPVSPKLIFRDLGPPERRAGARSAERSPRLSGARAGARAPFPPFARARDAAARATGCERGSSAEERNRV